MRIFAAMACAFLACTPAHGGQTNINLSVGGDRPTTATIALAVDGGPTIGFVDADPIPDRIGWTPVRYSFTAAGGATRITVSNGQPVSGDPASGMWLLSIVGFGLIGACLWYRVILGRA